MRGIKDTFTILQLHLVTPNCCSGFHRIRHYVYVPKNSRGYLMRARELLMDTAAAAKDGAAIPISGDGHIIGNNGVIDNTAYKYERRLPLS